MSMFACQKAVGLSVVDSSTGDQVAKVKEVFVDLGDNRVVAFGLERKGWFERDKILPFSRAASLGEDGIIISDKEALEDRGDLDSLTRAQLEGKRLLTEKGKDVGVVDDILFNEENGALVGYRVSGGLVKDLTEGKGWLPAKADLTVGKETVVLSGTAAKLFAGRGDENDR